MKFWGVIEEYDNMKDGSLVDAIYTKDLLTWIKHHGSESKKYHLVEIEFENFKQDKKRPSWAEQLIVKTRTLFQKKSNL